MNTFLGINFAIIGILFLSGIGFALFTGLFVLAFAEEPVVSAETGDHCLSEPAQIGDCFLPITSHMLTNETLTIVNNMDRELIVKAFYQNRAGQTDEFKEGIVLLSSNTTSINFTKAGHYSFYDDNRKSMLGEIFVEKHIVPKITVCHDGHDITIDRHALQAHLDHGDTELKCEGVIQIDDFEEDVELLLSNGGTHNPLPKQLKMDVLSIMVRDIYEKYPEVFVDSYIDYLKEAGIIE